MFAVNQSLGNLPLLKEFVNRTVNIGAISTLADILSGPEALLRFNDLISFSILSVEKNVSGIEEYTGSTC